MDSKVRIVVRIRGKVQGVSFRKQSLQVAKVLDVSGWVRNLPDGTVQACFEGRKSNVEVLLSWCSVGPERSQVQAVESKFHSYTGEFQDFRIL